MKSLLLCGAVFAAAPLLAPGCGRFPLDPSGTASVDAADPATATATADGNVAPAPQLRGTWSGQVQVSAPGFAWGPFDRLTLGFNDDGTLNAMQFASDHSPPHTFGPSAPDFPLQGSRVVPLTKGSVYNVEVTVQTADFASDRFHLRSGRRRQHDDGHHGLRRRSHRRLDNGVLDVAYSMTGTLLIAPIGANASGQLRPDLIAATGARAADQLHVASVSARMQTGRRDKPSRRCRCVRSSAAILTLGRRRTVQRAYCSYTRSCT